MKRFLKYNISIVVLLVALVLALVPGSAANAAGEVITSTETGGAWGDSTTWVGGQVPDLDDDSVVIATTNGDCVTLSAATTVKGSLTINSGAELITGGYALTLEGDFVNNGLFDPDGSNLIIAGTAPTQNIAGFSTTGTVSMTKTAGVATFTGNVTGGGLTLNGPSGTLNLGVGRVHLFSGAWTRTNGTLEGGSSDLRIAGTVTGSTGTFTPGTGTVTYNGTAQSIASLTYYRLKMQGTGVKTALGNIIVNENLIVNSGSNFTIGAYDLTVNGTTSITGLMTHSSPVGTKIYNGKVTINPGGVWKNDGIGNADIHLRGGLTHNSTTFSAGTGIYYFETNDQAIGGISPLTIPNLVVEEGRTLTNDNSGGLTVTSTLRGTGVPDSNGLTGGTLVQGVTGVLNLGMLDANFTLLTLGADTVGNTVNYSYGGAQAVRGIQYHNLSLAGSGVKTLPAGMTHLTGDLSLAGTASATTTADLDIDGDLSIANGAVLTVGGFNFNVDGTTAISGTSTSVNGKLIFGSSSGSKTFIGQVTVDSFGIWDDTLNAPVSFQGGLSSSGKTFTAGTGLYTFQTTALQSIGGTTAMTIPNVLIGDAVNLTNGNTAGLTINTSLSGTGTLTQGEGAVLNIGVPAAISLSNLDASAVGNLVNYNGSAQTVIPTTYHHLSLSTSGSKNIAGLTTVNGTLSLSGTASATTAANLTVGGNLSVLSGTSLTVAGYDFTVLGTTNIVGTLIHDNAAGAKTYTGAVTITGTWTNSGDAPVTFKGGLSYNGAAFTAGNGTYTFDVNSQVIDPDKLITIPNLVVAGGVTLTNTGPITVNSTLGGAGTWVQGSAGSLSINMPDAGFTVTAFDAGTAGNTVTYGNAGDQSIRNVAYHHLTLGGGGVKLLQAALTVGGNVIIVSGTTLDVSASNHAIYVGGNWTGFGLMSRSGTVTLQGASAQTINNGSFYDLVLNNPAGVTLVTTSTTVNNQLTLTSGKLATAGRLLIIGMNGSITGAGAVNYVTVGTAGGLRKDFAVSATPQTFTYPIGDAAAYTPIDLTLNSVSTAGNITARANAGEHPNVATLIGFDPNQDVNRYYTLTPAAIVFSTYNATFNYVASDLDAGANPDAFIVKRYSPSTSSWYSTSIGTRTSTSTQAIDIPFTASATVYSYAVGDGDDIPPAVANVTSSTADGYYNAGDVISDITVTFNEVVDVTGTPQLTLETGTVDAVLDYTGGTGTTTLTFSNYTVQPGDTSSDLDAILLDLNGGTIKDVYKNPAILTLSGTTLAANKAIVIDTTPPDTFILTNPALLSNSASASFTFNASESATFSCQVDGGGYGACASPYALADGLHTFDVYATDLAGNMDATPASYAWTIDATAPIVSSIALVEASPTARRTVHFTVTFSEDVTGVDLTDFTLTTALTVTGASVTLVEGSGAVYTVTVNTGMGNGTLRLDVVDDDTILDLALNPLNGAYILGPSYTIKKTLIFKSVGTNDGWVLESTPTSNVGGTMNSTATTFNVGDDGSKKQYRGILHFNTATLPDTAVITSVTLKILKAPGGAGNTSTLSTLLVDMTKPSFGAPVLATTDFQATAGKPAIFNAFTIAGSWYNAIMKATGRSYVNRTGTTQFRVRFTKGDDGDGLADYLLFYSGNASLANRPQLIVTYYIP